MEEPCARGEMFMHKIIQVPSNRQPPIHARDKRVDPAAFFLPARPVGVPALRILQRQITREDRLQRWRKKETPRVTQTSPIKLQQAQSAAPRFAKDIFELP